VVSLPRVDEPCAAHRLAVFFDIPCFCGLPSPSGPRTLPMSTASFAKSPLLDVFFLVFGSSVSRALVLT